MGYRIFMCCVPPHPYPLPKERANLCPAPVRSLGSFDSVCRNGLPLLGERVGVRGNVMDARNEPHKCKLQLPAESVQEPLAFGAKTIRNNDDQVNRA